MTTQGLCLFFVLLYKVLRFTVMNLKVFTITSLLAISIMASSQTPPELNKYDQLGRKQGHWIKKNPNGTIQYEGTFLDDHPVGEFKRYYDDKTVKSVMIFSKDGKEAEAVIYHPNGFIASRGKYINQAREGKWEFFSATINGYLISDEEYLNNQRNGLSQKFFQDSTLAEKVTYRNDRKEGEWIQYYPNGTIFLKSYYSEGVLNGTFDVWFENGKPEFSGAYKNNLREGIWLIYNEDGTLKYKLNYVSGVTNDKRMEDDGTKLLDSLEKNKGNIPDPEKTGVLR